MRTKKSSQKTMWRKINTRGLDAEEKAYLKDKLLHPHYEIKKHPRLNSPYDRTRKPRFGKYKKITYVETKGTTAKLSPLQKEFQKKHPRSYKIEYVKTETMYHKTKNVKRKLSNFLSI